MYQKSDRYVCADYDESVIAELEKLYLWTFPDVQRLTAVHLLEEKADKSWYRLICVHHCMQVFASNREFFHQLCFAYLYLPLHNFSACYTQKRHLRWM